MFQRILIPLDGSTRAERAIPVAARLARASGGSIILVRVASKSPGFWPSVEQQAILVQQALDADFAAAERYLADVAASFEMEGIPIEIAVRFGPTVSTILEVAADSQADLIVMCSHGYTGIRRRIMGSIAEKLAREASIPMLVLREDGPAPEAARPLRALVPLDGSSHAKAALEPAAFLLAALAGVAPGTLHLMRVVQPAKTHLDEGGLLMASEKARRYLSATAEHIREGLTTPAVAKLNMEVTWSVAVDTYVAEALIRMAENAGASKGEGEAFGDCDLIALATHGRDGLQRWVMGSITEQVLRDTKLPLLVVPQPKQDMTTESEQVEEEGRPDVYSSV